MFRSYFVGLGMVAGLGALAGSAVQAFPTNRATARVVVVNRAISEQEALSAQQNWCNGLLAISARHERSGAADARVLASQIIDQAYGYQMGTVLFKPTLTTNPQTFRVTREGALSYFAGGNPNFPGDTGFALKGWRACAVENAAIFLNGNSATTMGKVRFTGRDGKVTTVDKTWQFVKDDAGALRIVLHHSSLENLK